MAASLSVVAGKLIKVLARVDRDIKKGNNFVLQLATTLAFTRPVALRTPLMLTAVPRESRRTGADDASLNLRAACSVLARRTTLTHQAVFVRAVSAVVALIAS